MSPKIHFHKQDLEIPGVEGKYYFIQNPRTASTSMSAALKLTPKQHIPARAIRTEVGEEEWNQAYTFGLVRNPYTRILSQYHKRRKEHKIPSGLTFDEFVQYALIEKHPEIHNNPWMFSPQFDWFTDFEWNQIVEHVGKFEQIQMEWARIRMKLRDIGVQDPGKLFHLNYSFLVSGRKWQDFYANKKTLDIVENHYARDFYFFDYELLSL